LSDEDFKKLGDFALVYNGKEYLIKKNFKPVGYAKGGKTKGGDKYKIQIWETEEHREHLEPDTIFPQGANDEEVISEAKSLFEDFAAVEVEKNGEVIYHISTDRPKGKRYAKGGVLTFKTTKEADKYLQGLSDEDFKKLGDFALAYNGKEYVIKKNFKSVGYAKGGKTEKMYNVYYIDHLYGGEEEYETTTNNFEKWLKETNADREVEGEMPYEEMEFRVEEISIDKYAKGGRTYSRENRPSPSKSATIFNTGYRSRGNDGNIWEVKENIKGTHRWVKLKG